jgi:hypothetical protein
VAKQPTNQRNNFDRKSVDTQGTSRAVGLENPQDFEFRSEFDIEEDIEGELEHFVQLARLGFAQDARETFDHSLRDHLRLFPVFLQSIQSSFWQKAKIRSCPRSSGLLW